MHWDFSKCESSSGDLNLAKPSASPPPLEPNLGCEEGSIGQKTIPRIVGVWRNRPWKISRLQIMVTSYRITINLSVMPLKMSSFVISNTVPVPIQYLPGTAVVLDRITMWLCTMKDTCEDTSLAIWCPWHLTRLWPRSAFLGSCYSIVQSHVPCRMCIIFTLPQLLPCRDGQPLATSIAMDSTE